MDAAPSPRPSPPLGAREKIVRWQFALWLLNAALLVAAVVLWQKLRWRKISDSPAGITWHRSHTTHVDRNRDGLVDEETIRLPGGDAVIRRDSDLDGWFDLRYVERRGMATRLEQIREPAPRH